MSFPRSLQDISSAFVRAAQEAGAVPDAIRGLHVACDVFLSDPQAVTDAEEPAIALESRREALRAALGSHIHTTTLNALFLLQEQSLLGHLDDVLMASLAVAADIAGYREADVVSVIPLLAEERERVQKALEKRFSGTVVLRERVDASILGGLVVTCGDWRFDASAVGTINRLIHELYV